MSAAFGGYVSVVETLLIAGCDRSLISAEGLTALDYAGKSFECSELLRNMPSSVPNLDPSQQPERVVVGRPAMSAVVPVGLVLVSENSL
jgi:hypothetical protein